MERATFLIESTGEQLGCLLNPEHLVVRRLSGVRARRSIGVAVSAAALRDDPLVFTGGGTTELTLQLLFDVSVPGSTIHSEDVRDLTGPLWRLSESASVVDGVLQPEVCRLVWGKSVNVAAVVTAVAERLEHFASSGAPRRSWLSLRLRRVPDDAVPARPRPPAPPPPGAEAGGLADTHMVVGGGAPIGGGDGGGGGERLDELAARLFGDPTRWRDLANANDLDDPLHLQGGTVLQVPAREGP
jgi:hypothetical protein